MWICVELVCSSLQGLIQVLQYNRYLRVCGWYTQIPRRSTSYQQVKSTRVTRGSQAYLSTLFLFFVSQNGWKIDGIYSNTYHTRPPRFSREQAQWVDYKEKLDDVLFFHSSSLRDILQGQAGPDKYVRVPNDVTVIPTYVKLQRPIYGAQPIPEQWRGNAEREAQWSASQDVARAAAELAGPATPAAPIAGTVFGHTDLTLPNSLVFQGRCQLLREVTQ